MSERADIPVPRPERLPSRAPIRTMAIWLALIASVFLTRDRWDAWRADRGFPALWSSGFAVVTPDRRRIVFFNGMVSLGGPPSFHGRPGGLLGVHDIESGEASVEHQLVGGNAWLGGGRPDAHLPGPISPDSRTMALETERMTFVSDGPNVLKFDSMAHLLVLMDLGTGRTRDLKGHKGRAVATGFSPDGKLLVSGDDRGEVRVWDVDSGECLSATGDLEGRLEAIAFTERGERIVTKDSEGRCRVRDARTGAVLAASGGERHEATDVRFCTGGRHVVALVRGGSTELVETDTGRTVADLGRARALAVDPTGTRIATVGTDNAVRTWDAETGAPLAQSEACDGPILADGIRFSPDSARVAARCGDKADPVFRCWAARTGKLLYSFELRRSRAEFTPSGDRLLVWGGRNQARVLDARTGKTLALIRDVHDCVVIDADRIVASIARPSMRWQEGPILPLAPSPPSSRIFYRVRPEWWWGVAWLPQFWIIAALAALVAWSVWRDAIQLRRLRGTATTRREPQGRSTSRTTDNGG